MARDVRVILASEHAAVRRLISDAIEDEGETVIVGQAANVAKALALARNLRPDVAVIDSWLPHMAGRDGAPMSRIGGLDTAQAISSEIPNTRVILVNNLDTKSVADSCRRATEVPVFTQKTADRHQLFSLRQLYRDTVPLAAPVFAQVLLKEDASDGAEGRGLSDKAVVYGGYGMLIGLCLTLTIVFAWIGVPLAMLGAGLLLAGFTGKLLHPLWRYSSRRFRSQFSLIKTMGRRS
jgi:CheY-like chemotaxis protein